MWSLLTVNAAGKLGFRRANRVDYSASKPALDQQPDGVKLFPGWVRLGLVIGLPSLFWIGVVMLILRLTHH